MAGNFSIGAGLELSGEKQFADAVKSINKDLAVLGSEMKKVTAQFSENGTSMEALTAKQKVYNERADEQRKKVELMTAALENAKKEYGENSNKVKDWQIKLNNAEADLAKTERTLQDNKKAIKEYGKAQIQAAKDSEEFKKAQDKLKGAMNGLKVAAIAVTGAIVGFTGLALKAGLAADDMNTLAKQTGLTTEQIQKFQYATDLIDVPMETLTGSMAKLTKNMQSAKMGSKNTQAAFDALGISITDQNGNLRDNQDVFNEAINALGKMENATQRDAYAMQIFGKSAQDLNPLILGGADDLKKYGDQAERMGLILSQDALDGLNAINDKADEMKGVFKLAGAAIVSEFAPQINEALASIDVGRIVDGIKDFVNGIIGNKDAILTALSAIAAGLLAWNVTSIIMSVVGAINVFRDALITARVAQEGLNFAMKANVIGIVVTAVAALTAGLVVLWNTNDGFRDAVIGAWESLKTAALGLWETIKQVFTVDIPNAFNALIEFFKSNWQGLLLLLVNPFAGAIKLLYNLNPQFKQWVNGLVAGFKQWLGGFVDVGVNIAQRLWKGIKDSAGWLLGEVKKWCGGILKGIKAFFGIKSPSRVMAEVGGNIGKGMALGIEDSKDIVVGAAKEISGALLTEETRLQSELNKLQKKSAKTSEEALADSLKNQLSIVQNFRKEYESAIAEVEKAQSDMSQKLIEFGGLFQRTQDKLGNDIFKLADLQDEIDTINKYGEALESLKARGISDSLLGEIKGMSIEDALDYSNELLSKTDDEYAKYMALWEEKQLAAKEVAAKFYQDELDGLKAEFVDKIPSELSGIKNEMSDIGVNAGKGLASGFKSQSGHIKNTFVTVLQDALKEAKKSMEIKSPSRKWAEVGKFMAAGLGVGFAGEMSAVTKQINNSIPTDVTMTGQYQATAKMGEGIVNGLAGLMGGQANGGTYTINVLLDGKTVAQTVFDPLRNVAKQRGVALG